jgi:hypothetical protein
MTASFRRLFIAAGIAIGLSGAALAAGTQTYTISSTTFTDLGVAPVQVQTLGQSVAIVVADSLPAVGTNGINLLPGPPVVFQPADASSHVYAAYLGATTTIAATPIYSTGGGGGGGAVTAVAGAFVDGAIATIGTEADAAWTSGSGSLIAISKAIAAKFPALNGDGGSLSHVTNFPATQAVSAALGAFVDGSIATLGTEADAAWASGGGTLVAIEKAVAGFVSTVATNTGATNINLGAPGATVCASDTGSCSLNALLQRIAQRITSSIGQTQVSGIPATPTVSASAAVNSLVLKASATSNPGGVSSFHAENGTATSGYCVLYNGTTAPSTGALTAANVLAFVLLPANGYCDFDHTMQPLSASTGAVVLLTSAANPFTYTTGVITGSITGVAL